MKRKEELRSCERCGQAIPKLEIVEHLERCHCDFSLSKKK